MKSDYLKIWTGNAASNLSDGLTFVAMPLIAAALTDDPIAVSGLTVAYTVPRIAAVLGIGVLIDRIDRRRLLYVANFLRAAAFLALAASLAAGIISIPVLYVVYGVVGLIETTSDSAVFAVLPTALPRERLDRANSQIAGAQLVIDEFVGPPLGGFLFAAAAFLPIGASAFACAIAALCFLLLKGTYQGRPVGAERTSIRSDLRVGVTWLRGNRIVAGLVVVSGIASIAYSLPFSYLVLFADRALGLDSTGYGLLMSFSALGGLLGTFLAPRLRKRVGYAPGIVAALALGAVSITLCGLASHVVVAGLALAAYICHAVVWNVLAGTVRQKIVPPELLGRTGAVGRLAGYLGIALGAGLGGWLASEVGLRVPFVLSGALFVVCVAFAVRLTPAIRAWQALEDEAAVIAS